jgi:hypothetical protein
VWILTSVTARKSSGSRSATPEWVGPFGRLALLALAEVKIHGEKVVPWSLLQILAGA